MELHFFSKHFHHRATHWLLLTLLAIDLLFIVVHICFTLINHYHYQFEWSFLSNYMLDIDRSYSEYFQYLKYLNIIVILILLLVQKKGISYIAWLILFTMLLLDDSLQFH